MWVKGKDFRIKFKSLQIFLKKFADFFLFESLYYMKREN